MTIWPLLRRIGIAAAAVISLGLLLLYTTPAGDRARIHAAETLVVTRYQPKIWLLVGHRRSEQIIEEFRSKGTILIFQSPDPSPSAAASTPSLKTTLSAADGRRMNVFLAAPDERKEAVTGDSCMAVEGDTL